MKKLFKILLFTYLILISFLPVGNFLTHQNLINTKETFIFSLNFFDARDILNQVVPAYQLKFLFVEQLYINLVKEELRSFKSLSMILSKPFTKLWITKEVAEFIIKQTKYLIFNTRKFFCVICRVILNLKNSHFNLLAYLQSNLNNYPVVCRIVLRC